MPFLLKKKKRWGETSVTIIFEIHQNPDTFPSSTNLIDGLTALNDS